MPWSISPQSDPNEWSRYFAVNLFGTMHCTRAVLPAMIEAGSGDASITIVSDAARYGDAKPWRPTRRPRRGPRGSAVRSRARWADGGSRSTASASAP